MLEIVKMLLEIPADDHTRDDILTHYIDMAVKIALAYCNTDSLSEEYDSTIAELAVFLYKNKDSLPYKQKVEGERSVTFGMTDGIPDYIKSALPLPRVRVVGDV